MADFTVPASLVGTAANAVTRNAAIEGKIVPLQCAMLEIDTDGTLAVSSYLDLIPAALNKNGLLIMSLKGQVTEIVNAGSTAPIITIRDGASSPNTLGTLTATDADAIGDYVAPGSYVEWESLVDGTDYSAQHVEAGVKVECACTTLAVASSGTTAGKVLVLVEFYAVPSKE